MNLSLISSSIVLFALAGGSVEAAQASEEPSPRPSASVTPPEEPREPPKGVRLRHSSDSVLVEWGATSETIKASFPKTICSSMGSGESFCAPDLLEGWSVGFGSAYSATQYFQLYNNRFYEYTVEFEASAQEEIASAFTTAMGRHVSSQREQVQNAFGAKWDATTTVWKLGDVVVTVSARAAKMDRGRITITNVALTPPKKSAEAAPF